MFIDGDSIGQEVIEAALGALGKEGKVVQSTFFGPPRKILSNRWDEFLKQHGIRYMHVPRKSMHLRDPNDVVVSSEAQSWASISSDTHVALLVDDVDYIPLVAKLRKMGKQVIVVLPTASKSVLLQQFERTGAHVIVALPGRRPIRRVRAVLSSGGNGHIEVLKIIRVWTNML